MQIKKVFYERGNKTIHFRTPSRRKYFLNQNIERVNGTYCERLKVMRGMQRQETAQILMDGERFYYNHIRPHMGLDGKTPAQVAKLPVPNGTLWNIYIKKELNDITHV
ncbi:MAG: integrase core domain-containing protein [Candidatus Thermoplasmatota archaeon]|nr:integrase core domain-containing protein [Candidatus Thermoplasmatota archaeon]